MYLILAELLAYSYNAVDASGNIYIADTRNHVIRKVSSSSGNISRVAGIAETSGYSGDGGLATFAELSNPDGVAVDTFGHIYIADADNHVIRMVTINTGNISIVAGIAKASGYRGDGGLATSATLSYPSGVACDALGNIYIADTNNHDNEGL